MVKCENTVFVVVIVSNWTSRDKAATKSGLLVEFRFFAAYCALASCVLNTTPVSVVPLWLESRTTSTHLLRSDFF